MKKITRYLSTVLLVIFVLLALPLTSNAESMRCKKIISVVYDDSGSMQGDNQAYANYSMQTFAAMVNEEDDLYITYMSAPNKSEEINTSDLLNAVSDIRDHDRSSAKTPFQSVITAMEKLTASKDTNPNTQYWLVVFTDGGFNDGYNMTTVEEKLDEFSTTKMENGTEPRIIFMTIGDDEEGTFTPRPSNKDIEIITANDGQDIADSLSNIASSITGRFSVDSSAISFTDGHTLTVSSNVPLLNISILVQNADADVVSILDPDMTPVSIKHEIPVSIPQHITVSSPEIADMHGVITLAGDDSANIPAGQITINLSDDIDPKDIVVMLEPAIELKIKFYSEGQEITDPDLIAVTMPELVAKAAVYEYGTDIEILESLLPSGYTKSMEHSIDDNEITSADSFIIDPLEIDVGNNKVHASLDLKGFFHLETTVEFSPALMKVDSISAALDYDGSPRRVVDGVTDGNDVIYVTRLNENRTGYRFTICVDGEPIDEQMALKLEQQFKDSITADFSNYTVEVMSDGTFLVFPNKQPWYMPTLIYYFSHKGEQTVEVNIDGISAKGTLDFKLFYDPWEIVVPILWMLLIIYIIWWILFKKHFPKVTLCMGIGKKNAQGQVSYRNCDEIDLNWLGCFRHRNIFSFLFNLIILLFPIASKVRFGGYTFIGQTSLVRSAHQYLVVRNVKRKAVSTVSPQPSSISQDSSTELDNKLYIRNGESYVKFWIDN